MKAWNTALKIAGFLMVAVGIVCLLACYWEKLTALRPCKKEKTPKEFEDFADV